MARIHAVYFDADDTDLRAAVLRAAGYEVDECCSLIELADCLKAGQSADLVCIADTWDKPAEGALALARGLSRAPNDCGYLKDSERCSPELPVGEPGSSDSTLGDLRPRYSFG